MATQLTTTQRGFGAFCTALALVATRTAAAQTLPTPVATIASFPLPAPVAYLTNMRFGPDGLIYANDGQNIWQQSGVNVDGFGAAPFGTVPTNGSDAGPLNFSQNGQTIVIGNGAGGVDYGGPSDGLLYTLPASGGVATFAGTVLDHFDLIPAPAAMPSAGSKMLVSDGAFNPVTSTSVSAVDLFDDATGQVTRLIQNIPGASSSIAFDSANRLYVGIGYGDSRGQIRRFSLPLLNAAAAAGQPLDWTSGQLFNTADDNSGQGMFFDARGNLFVGGPDGVAVFGASGASQVYSTGPGSSPVVSYNATNDQFALYLIGLNDPLDLGYNPLIYNAASFSVASPPTTAWASSAGGNWSETAHWDQTAAPDGIDGRATLGNSAAPQTIALDQPITLGSLAFDSSAKYVVSGSSSLTMQVSATIAAIDDANGSHEIAAPLVLASDTDITVANTADTLTLSGGIAGPGMLSKEGHGTLEITGPTTYGGNTAVERRHAAVRHRRRHGHRQQRSDRHGRGRRHSRTGRSRLGTRFGDRQPRQIINDSTAGGLVVSAASQVVGGIDGEGITTIASGGSLAADHIVQSALVIGGTATDSALVTIAASSDSAMAATSAAGPMASLAACGAFGEGLDAVLAVSDPPTTIAVRTDCRQRLSSAKGRSPQRFPNPRRSRGAIALAAAVVWLKPSTAARRRDASPRFEISNSPAASALPLTGASCER